MTICDECEADSDYPLCSTCMNTLFDEYEKDQLSEVQDGKVIPQQVFGYETQEA